MVRGASDETNESVDDGVANDDRNDGKRKLNEVREESLL